MAHLPFSPLTHEELNRRSAEAVTKAGHRAITCAKYGGVTPDDRRVFAESAADFDRYNGAALVRCDVDLGLVAA